MATVDALEVDRSPEVLIRSEQEKNAVSIKRGQNTLFLIRIGIWMSPLRVFLIRPFKTLFQVKSRAILVTLMHPLEIRNLDHAP